MELFQKIEALTGQKMEKFEADQDAALVLLDGVNEAQRIATMQVTKTSSVFLRISPQQLKSCIWHSTVHLFSHFSMQMREIDKGKGGKRKGRKGDHEGDDVGDRIKFKRKY